MCCSLLIVVFLCCSLFVVECWLLVDVVLLFVVLFVPLVGVVCRLFSMFGSLLYVVCCCCLLLFVVMCCGLLSSCFCWRLLVVYCCFMSFDIV